MADTDPNKAGWGDVWDLIQKAIQKSEDRADTWLGQHHLDPFFTGSPVYGDKKPATLPSNAKMGPARPQNADYFPPFGGAPQPTGATQSPADLLGFASMFIPGGPGELNTVSRGAAKGGPEALARIREFMQSLVPAAGSKASQRGVIALLRDLPKLVEEGKVSKGVLPGVELASRQQITTGAEHSPLRGGTFLLGKTKGGDTPEVFVTTTNLKDTTFPPHKSLSPSALELLAGEGLGGANRVHYAVLPGSKALTLQPAGTVADRAQFLGGRALQTFLGGPQPAQRAYEALEHAASSGSGRGGNSRAVQEATQVWKDLGLPLNPDPANPGGSEIWRVLAKQGPSVLVDRLVSDLARAHGQDLLRYPESPEFTHRHPQFYAELERLRHTDPEYQALLAESAKSDRLWERRRELERQAQLAFPDTTTEELYSTIPPLIPRGGHAPYNPMDLPTLLRWLQAHGHPGTP